MPSIPDTWTLAPSIFIGAGILPQITLPAPSRSISIKVLGASMTIYDFTGAGAAAGYVVNFLDNGVAFASRKVITFCTAPAGLDVQVEDTPLEWVLQPGQQLDMKMGTNLPSVLVQAKLAIWGTFV